MPRVKKMKTVYTFPSTVQALKMEQCCREESLDGRLIPVPRQLSSGCGMAWAVSCESRSVLDTLISREKINVEGVYELLL